MFARWAKMLGEDRWLTDPRFADDEARGNHAEDISKRVTEWTIQRTTEQALKELEAARIPAGPLYTPQQALDDAHIRQAGLLVDTDYPGVARRVPLAPTPVDLSEAPGRFRHRAPTLGEHTNAILGELGYSPTQIDALRTRGVV
jgi:crotonobetainyl-CoA:carnitine CoA-transferase CaiB-like acyl-CoA transferase